MARLFQNGGPYLETSVGTVTATPVTMSCWYLMTTGGLAQGVIGVFGASEYRSILITSANSVGAYAIGTASHNVLNLRKVVVGRWAHFCATFTTSRTSIYVDGIEEELINPTSAGTFNKCVVGQGRSSTGQVDADGIIAQVGFWNVELRPSEILYLSSGASPQMIRAQNLKAYYKLDDVPSENTGRISSVNGNQFLTNTNFNLLQNGTTTCSFKNDPPIIGSCNKTNKFGISSIIRRRMPSYLRGIRSGS